MMKSPLRAHGKLIKQLDILKNNPKKAAEMGLSSDRGDAKDFEAISKLEQEIKNAKKSHNNNRSEEDDMQAREDEDAARGSALEMTQAQPLDASIYFVEPDQMDYSSVEDIANAARIGAEFALKREKRDKELDDIQNPHGMGKVMTRGKARKKRRENKKN